MPPAPLGGEVTEYYIPPMSSRGCSCSVTTLLDLTVLNLYIVVKFYLFTSPEDYY